MPCLTIASTTDLALAVRRKQRRQGSRGLRSRAVRRHDHRFGSEQAGSGARGQAQSQARVRGRTRPQHRMRAPHLMRRATCRTVPACGRAIPASGRRCAPHLRCALGGAASKQRAPKCTTARARVRAGHRANRDANETRAHGSIYVLIPARESPRARRRGGEPPKPARRRQRPRNIRS